MKTLTMTKEFANALRWVMKARNKDRRGPDRLRCVSYHEGIIAATDGFRIHATQVESENDRIALQPEGNAFINFIPRLMGNWEKKKSLLVIEESDTTFPDLTKVLPDGNTQVASFAINPRYLKEALDGIPDDMTVIVRLFGEGKPVIVETHKAIAYIMPMLSDPDRLKPHAFDSFLPLNKVAVKTEEPTSEKV